MWNQTYDADSEPIICSKCDTRFNNETEYKQHHHVVIWILNNLFKN
jgi:hypothetical protein